MTNLNIHRLQILAIVNKPESHAARNGVRFGGRVFRRGQRRALRARSLMVGRATPTEKPSCRRVD